MRIKHDIQSIIYTYLDSCEVGSVDIDHNIEACLQPQLLEFSSNLYFNAGADLLDWGSLASDEDSANNTSTDSNNYDTGTTTSTI